MKKVLICLFSAALILSCGTSSQLTEQEKQQLQAEYDNYQTEINKVNYEINKTKQGTDQMFKQAGSLEKQRKLVSKQVVFHGPKAKFGFKTKLPFKYKPWVYTFKGMKFFAPGVMKGAMIMKSSLTKN